MVGYSDNADEQPRAFRWTPRRGMEDLNFTYAALLKEDSQLIKANAISPDGRTSWGKVITHRSVATRLSCWILAAERNPLDARIQGDDLLRTPPREHDC